MLPFFMFAACTEIVSILYALVFGAGEACVDIGFWSIMSAFGAFMVIVVGLQFVARRLWARATRVPATPDVSTAEPSTREFEKPYDDDPSYRKSAIRSSRR